MTEETLHNFIKRIFYSKTFVSAFATLRPSYSVEEAFSMYSSYTHIRFPCLEQYIILQLSPTTNFTVQMSTSQWQLSQTHPHTTLNVTPIRDFIYHLTANFFDRCPAHPNPLDRFAVNYSLADLHHQYKEYIHKRPKHILF